MVMVTSLLIGVDIDQFLCATRISRSINLGTAINVTWLQYYNFIPKEIFNMIWLTYVYFYFKNISDINKLNIVSPKKRINWRNIIYNERNVFDACFMRYIKGNDLNICDLN